MPRTSLPEPLRHPPPGFEDTSRADLEDNINENNSILTEGGIWDEEPQAHTGATCPTNKPMTVGLGIVYSETETRVDGEAASQSLLTEPVWWSMLRWEIQDQSRAAPASVGMASDYPQNDNILDEANLADDESRDSDQTVSPPFWWWDTFSVGSRGNQMVGSEYATLVSSSSGSSTQATDSGISFTENSLDREAARYGPVNGRVEYLRREASRSSRISAPPRCFFRRRDHAHPRQSQNPRRWSFAALRSTLSRGDRCDNVGTGNNDVGTPTEPSSNSDSSRDTRAVYPSRGVQARAARAARERPVDEDFPSQSTLRRRCTRRMEICCWIIIFCAVAFGVSWALVVSLGST